MNRTSFASRYQPSDELIGFERAEWLLLIGVGSILLSLICGVFLCRLDLSAGKRHRSMIQH